MVESTSKSTPGIILVDLTKGRDYPKNKTIMQRKKAREMPSQEQCFSPPQFEATKGDVKSSGMMLLVNPQGRSLYEGGQRQARRRLRAKVLYVRAGH
ncbi:uncharacterized protein G2W53_033354 [Senna tora]|uniref:Uncharacterized protein n=1 Tax=Senna tora TaxID=362788 RepID=A0A834SXE0_9FABA|nr:uncharacterized protein G2W53_033354 [Senna tora]